MTRFTRRTLCSLICFHVMAIGLVTHPAFSGNRDAPTASSTAGEAGHPRAGSTEASLETLYERLNQAEAQWDQTRKALRKARQRRYPRGQALEELRQKARDDAQAVVKAEEAFLRRVDQARYTAEETRAWNAFTERAEQIQEARALKSNSR